MIIQSRNARKQQQHPMHTAPRIGSADHLPVRRLAPIVGQEPGSVNVISWPGAATRLLTGRRQLLQRSSIWRRKGHRRRELQRQQRQVGVWLLHNSAATCVVWLRLITVLFLISVGSPAIVSDTTSSLKDHEVQLWLYGSNIRVLRHAVK